MASVPVFPGLDPVPSNADDLSPPYLNHAVLNVLGAEVGGGIRHIENFMYVNIPRWSLVEPFDSFEFYMRGQLFSAADVHPGQEDQPHYELAIAQERVPEGFSFPCYSQVIRAASGAKERSPDMTWFIKSNRPGGSDMGHDSFHPALKFSLPADLAAPGAVLVPDRASEGAWCTIEPYPNMRVRDTVEFFWDGQRVTLQLDDDHVSGAKPIEVFVPGHIILDSASGIITIRFSLEDEVLNRSGPDRRFSQAFHLESDLDPSLLDRRPYFRVAGKDAFEVNFDTQGAGPFDVEVVAPSRLPNDTATPVGSWIVVTLNGIRADGTSLSRSLPPVEARIGRSVFIDVDAAIIKELINGTLRVSYELQFPKGTPLATSQRVAVTIFGTVTQMPAVEIVQNEGGQINPEAPFITVKFPDYVPYGRDYNVTLRLEVVLSNGSVVSFEQTRLAGNPPPQPRTILREDFARFIGLGRVRVFYKVDDGIIEVTDVGTLTVRDSESLYVSFGEQVPQLPRPEIEGVDENDNIDPDELLETVAVTLPYALTKYGDQITWIWTGTGGADGSDRDSFMINGATEGKPLVFDVPRALVANNRDGEIRLRYYLERENEDTRYSHELVVSVGKALGDFEVPEVIGATKSPDQLMPEVVTDGATIRVTFPEMLPTDRVRAEWRGLAGIGTWEDTQNGSASKVLDFNVPKEVVGANILPAGRDIEVQYFLIRGRETDSPVLRLRLLTLTTKPMPLIDGIGDVPVLELFNLLNTARTRTAPWLFSHREQRVWMEYSGIRAGGAPFIDTTYSANRLGEVDEVAGLSPPAPVDKLKDLRDDSILTITVKTSFDRSQHEANAVTMNVKQYRIQALPGTLPHPTLEGADGTGPAVSVNPLNIEHNRVVNVSYSPMSPLDKITLEWIHHDGAIPYIPPKDGLDGGTVAFLIDMNILARSVNSQVQLRYSIVRGGHTIESYIQTVNVGTISLDQLPAPTLNGLAEGLLDLTQFTGDALAAVKKWPLSAAGTYAQRVWLMCTSPTAEPLYVLRNHVLTATQQANGLSNVAVARAWLLGLKYGAEVTVTCKVTYDGSELESKAIVFPMARFSVKQGLLDITTFTNNDMNGWVSFWDNARVVLDAGNYYWRSTATHGTGVSLSKSYVSLHGGMCVISFKCRVSSLYDTANRRTSINISAGSLTVDKEPRVANAWEEMEVSLGSLPAGSFDVRVLFKNISNNRTYELDDIRLALSS
ncbi:hypothetical protein [Pseudomonas lactucae]|uniref:Uncharacterized protein n=1 Tax=Pseudomonas lactucae TaxID=2813360 RepID=A0A9X0YGF7_9PSED|nr:hypothetical protein [Pseudomonas lactucae]MBN2979437.1 hypothetical protein [Pseudomonas lactucae]MBN2986580.1 hypothetical protein [Pseudomonas lactucae]